MLAAERQSPGHSAHVGQEVEVHYRWHPLYGRRVRRQYSEQRAAGRFVHVEAAPGVVTVVAAWMLDPVACAGMEIGAPRVAVSALVDLHHLLIERGFRRSSRGDPNIVQEEQDEDTRRHRRCRPRPRASSAWRSIRARLRGMSPSERSTALARLASLLLEAAGVAAGERDDDER